MNENHSKLCPSPEWATHIQDEVLPVVTEHENLGSDMLEIGPGPGAATEWLRHQVKHLTALDIDEEAAAKLAAMYAGTNVEVVTGSAAGIGYPDESFDSVGCFTMLHHIPTAAGQNKLLAEALRVLRPGGVLIGSDSLPSDGLHAFHEGDTCHPVEPSTLLVRLQTLGFGAVMVAVDEVLMFTARKPSSQERDQAA